MSIASKPPRERPRKFLVVVDKTPECHVAVRFATRRYCDNPLIVQGPGAGPEVTAGGVFADLLRLSAYLGAHI